MIIRPATPSHARRCRVHRIPPRVRDDRDTPLEWDETGMDIQVICGFGKAEYFCGRGWTGIRGASPSGKSVPKRQGLPSQHSSSSVIKEFEYEPNEKNLR
jgi:hypothetical protein